MNRFRLINGLLRLSFSAAGRRFRRSCRDVASVQNGKLLDTLAAARNTAYGRRFRFESISNADEYRARVPLTEYSDYEPYIDSIRRGMKDVLSEGPCTMLVPSSGTSAATKLIPFNDRLRSEFLEGTGAWMEDIYRNWPGVSRGRFYWLISPPVPFDGGRQAAVPTGFGDDLDYFHGRDRGLLRRLLVSPGPAAWHLESDPCRDDFQYATLLALLRERMLSFISVWSPAYLNVLLGRLDPWAESLIRDIHDGTVTGPSAGAGSTPVSYGPPDGSRAEELAAAIDRGDGIRYGEIWPRLDLISCWGDSTSREYMLELQSLFPHVSIQPKGLLATEGCVSIPLAGSEGAALSINSHFFEFLRPGGNATTCLAHELREGEEVSIVLTTGGGLYRYRLGDRVKVTGRVGQCPLLRFMGRDNMVSDFFGEKLNEHHLSDAVKRYFKQSGIEPRFYLFALEKNNGRACYTLFIETDVRPPGRLAEDIEILLKKNFNYENCRNLGQLGHLRIFLIDCGGLEDYYRRKGRHHREGTIKPPVLDLEPGWSAFFSGAYLT